MALMPRRRAAVATLALALAASTTAAAWHEPKRAVTDYSASTLNAGEWRLYLGTLLEYGITDTLEIGTMPLIDLLRVPNLLAKWTIFSVEGFAVAISSGFFTTKPSYFRDDLPDARIYVIPAGLYASYRIPSGDVGLHLGLNYTTAGTTGEIPVDEALGFEGQISGTTLRLSPVIELRTSRSFAWVIEGSLSLSQTADGSLSTTYTSDDKRTTIEVFTDASVADDGQFRGNVSLSAYWSWQVFNLRLGLGYGHAEAPMVGLFFDQLTILPEFNAYWRF